MQILNVVYIKWMDAIENAAGIPRTIISAIDGFDLRLCES